MHPHARVMLTLPRWRPNRQARRRGRKHPLHWLLSKKTGTAAALKAIAGHYLCSALSSTFDSFSLFLGCSWVSQYMIFGH